MYFIGGHNIKWVLTPFPPTHYLDFQCLNPRMSYLAALLVFHVTTNVNCNIANDGPCRLRYCSK